MTTIKIAKFLGEAPKIAAELLPETVSQYAMNCKLYSGNLMPFPVPTNAETVTRTGTIESIYPLRDGSNNRVWLHWTEDVDVATSLLANDATQRVYFTGNGAPKQTDFSLATTGVGDYPIATRPLGLPAPTVAATATVSSSSAISVSNRSRSNNIATLTLGSTPNFGVGTVVTIASVGGTGYNLTNVAVTAIVGSTISYNCPGADEANTASGGGTCAFGGSALLRNYVYTWYTDWAEESQPAPVSTDVSAYDGQQVNIASLPTTAPTGYSGIVTHKRIYRAVSSPSGAYYAYVGEVTLATATYTDTLTDSALGAVLDTDDFDMPDASMIGLVNMANGILAGFFDNQLCFSEPYKPWAWPIKYRKTINSKIIGIGALATSMVVVTEKSPSLVTGTHPSVMSVNRLDVNYPCVAKRSVVNIGAGIAYACPDGVAYISTAGNALITRLVHYRDTWLALVDPTTIVARYYNGKYFASHSTGSFVFEQEEQVGGIYTQANVRFTAGHYDFSDGYLYFIDTTDTHQVKRWDDPSGAAGTFDWWSKIFRMPLPTNYGAARVLADYDVAGAGVVAQNNAITAANLAVLPNDEGSLGDNGVAEYALADSALQNLIQTPYAVTFQFYVDGSLRFQKQVAANTVFRLPMGYKADNCSVRVASSLRLREIQIAETPLGLGKV